MNIPDGISLEDVVGPYDVEPEDPGEALEKIQAQQQQMAAMAFWAAEKVWPGFQVLAEKLNARERELLHHVTLVQA